MRSRDIMHFSICYISSASQAHKEARGRLHNWAALCMCRHIPRRIRVHKVHSDNCFDGHCGVMPWLLSLLSSWIERVSMGTCHLVIAQDCRKPRTRLFRRNTICTCDTRSSPSPPIPRDTYKLRQCLLYESGIPKCRLPTLNC